jgi:hypothetical protein
VEEAYKAVRSGTAISYQTWNTGGSERMRLDSIGRVGIGTSSPTRPLTVNGNNGAGMIINDATNDKALRFRATGDAFYIEATNNAESAYANLALEGNVGIGTASPTKTLDINKASATFRIRDASAGNDFAFKTAAGPVSVIGCEANTSLALMTNNTERIRILSSGGITFNGDTSTANALDDYEEGTWTPSSPINCTINTVYQGYYIKVGNLVHAYCYINLTTSAITYAFYGLPFSSLGYGPATRYYPAGIAFNGHSYVESGSSLMYNDSTSTFTANVMFSATYRTT